MRVRSVDLTPEKISSVFNGPAFRLGELETCVQKPVFILCYDPKFALKCPQQTIRTGRYYLLSILASSRRSF